MYNMEKKMYIGNGFRSLVWGAWYSVIKEYYNAYLVFDENGSEIAIPKKDFSDRTMAEEAKHRAENLMSLKDGHKEKDDPHYDNSNGSLYIIGNKLGLNSWEQDIFKRVVRCRKKGQFKEDLEKTVRVIELYLKEYKL
jgi:hypothetical protein